MIRNRNKIKIRIIGSITLNESQICRNSKNTSGLNSRQPSGKGRQRNINITIRHILALLSRIITNAKREIRCMMIRIVIINNIKIHHNRSGRVGRFSNRANEIRIGSFLCHFNRRSRINTTATIIHRLRIKIEPNRKTQTIQQRITTNKNRIKSNLTLFRRNLLNSIRKKLHIGNGTFLRSTFGIKNGGKVTNILTTKNSSKKSTREKKCTNITPKRTIYRRLRSSSFQLTTDINRNKITAQSFNNTNRLNITKIRIIYHDVRKRVIRAFRRSERCFFDKRHNFSVINFSRSVNSKPV